MHVGAHNLYKKGLQENKENIGFQAVKLLQSLKTDKFYFTLPLTTSQSIVPQCLGETAESMVV